MNSLRVFLGGAALIALAACSGASAPANPPLAGASIGAPFVLTDQDGHRVSDRDFAGRWRIVYFGYTFCPDACPTDVQVIAGAMKAFAKADGAAARTVAPIFISIDPARDTPAALKQFVGAFGYPMTALTGPQPAIDAVARGYAIYHARGKDVPGGGYLMDHSRQAYLMDKDGKPIALLPIDKGIDATVAELTRWVR